MKGALRLARFGALFSLLASLFGCAHLIALQDDVLNQVSRYEAEQEYGKALEVIALVSPTHPQRARLMQKRPQILAKARALEQTTARRADELASQGRWGDAVTAYMEALDKLPQSQSLRAGLVSLKRRQAQRVEELNVDRLVAKARWIERSLPVQEAIVATNPDNRSANRDLARLRGEAADVAQELTDIGLAALEENNLGLAGRTLPIASRLSPNPAATRARDRLDTEEAKSLRSSQDRGLDKMREEESRKLLADYRRASRKNDLRRARLIMTRLLNLDGQNPELIRESARLRVQLEMEIKRNMDEGNSLYGRGKFAESMASWSRVLELDPENEIARASIERAGRVIEKLRQLREEQASVPKEASRAP